MNMQVLGIKHHKGSFKKETTGEIIDYDYIALHTAVELPGSENTRGYSSAIIRMHDGKQWDAIKSFKYPGTFDVLLKIVADGKGGFNQECVSLTPVKAAA